MSLIVVTGGIGCGKSTVLRDFHELGAEILDADEIAHDLYRPGSTLLHQIALEFGEGLLLPDGTLDRPAMARRVFHDAAALEHLNRLVHPAVYQVIRDEESRCGKNKILVVAIPLWYECLDKECPLTPDAVIATWCGQETQQTRLHQRGWSDDEIFRRISSQFSADEKAYRADYVIMTDCTWAQLREQCTLIYNSLKTIINTK